MTFYGTKAFGTLIDFEANFNEYGLKWVKNSPMKIDSLEAARKQMQLIYEDWVRTPMNELAGETPKEFFNKIEDIDDLLELVLRYGDLGEGKVPRVLLNRILAFGEKALEPLIELAGDAELQMRDSWGSGRGPIIAVGLLRELQSPKAIPVLVDIIDKREGMDIIGDAAIGALEAIGEEVIEPVLAALEKTGNDSAVTSFASVLANFKEDERIFQALTGLFKKGGYGYEIFGGLLGKYGDNRALPILQEAITDPGLGYFAFNEIASAIEELGGTVEIQRDFSDDPWFQIQEKFGNLGHLFAEKAAMVKGYGSYKGIGSHYNHDLDGPDDDDNYWLDGEDRVRKPVSSVKIGRNESCPCGSGKKYKKCCGKGT